MKKTGGFSLLNVLIALLIFTFGMLALAGAYFKVSATQSDNESFTNAGVLAESLRSTLSASPSLLTRMKGFNSGITPTDPVLKDWVDQLKEQLPNGSAQVPDPDGLKPAACTTSPCTVTLEIKWQKKESRSQTFILQVGFS